MLGTLPRVRGSIEIWAVGQRVANARFACRQPLAGPTLMADASLTCPI